jgi:hypothetical protein
MIPEILWFGHLAFILIEVLSDLENAVFAFAPVPFNYSVKVVLFFCSENDSDHYN